MTSVTKQSPNLQCLTNDSVKIMVSIAVRYKVIDPYSSHFFVVDRHNTMNLMIISALKNIVSSCPWAKVLKYTSLVSDKVFEYCKPRAALFGVELEEFLITGLSLPPHLRETLASEGMSKANSQAKKVKAERGMEVSKLMSKAADLMKSSSTKQIKYLNWLENELVEKVGAGSKINITPSAKFSIEDLEKLHKP